MDNQSPAGAQPVGYMDAAKFRVLQMQKGPLGGILTMVTKHRAFPEDVALYAAPAALPEVLEQAKRALESAQNGLRWYRDMHPEDTDGSDDEADEEIDVTLAALREALKGQQ